MNAVVLLSGGLDSYTAAAIAGRQGFQLYALSVRYGQRHARELEAARAIAARLQVAQHREISVDLSVFGGSALTGSIDVPKNRIAAGAASTPDAGHRTPDSSTAIPVTYVPARNTVFLSLALAWAEVLGATDIVIGANAIDYSGYPDCRPAFLDAFERLASVATKAGVEGARFRIHAPLLAMSKGEIIRRGLELGLDYGLTHSCYDPGTQGAPCGRCDSCVLRAKGFEEAGALDPLLVRRSPRNP
jgi:7-cyano-7-deazaguanine synthase